MIRTKPPGKIGAKIDRKYELPVSKTKISLPPDQRPKEATMLHPPEGVIRKKGEYWCPYCAVIIRFVHNDYVGVNHCPRCGVSDRDFHVRRANKTWPE